MNGPMDFLKAAGGILATLAPTAASMLGGPFAGMATAGLLKALDLTPDTSHDDLMRAVVGATPEQLLKLKELDNQLILDMRKLDVDLEKISAEDRDSARKREIATGDWTPRIIAALIIGAWGVINYYIFSGHILPPEMMNIAMRSMGTLDAALGLILGYYFGSSAGSKAKNDQIAMMVDHAAKNGK